MIRFCLLLAFASATSPLRAEHSVTTICPVRCWCVFLDVQ